MSVISPPLQQEQAWVAAAQQNAAEFDKLYRHYYPHILRFVWHRVNQKEVAEDLTAQVFEKAMRKIREFVWQDTSFSAWLYLIAKRLIIDYIRQQKRRHTVELNPEIQVTDGSSVEASVESEISGELLKQLITTLPEREQQVVYLKFYNGYTNRLIAQLTGLSETNIGTIIYRAVRLLKHKLGS